MFKRFTSGFAVGYVFGARAGQKRYEELTELAERALESPLLREALDQTRRLATRDNGVQLLKRVRDRMPVGGSPGSDKEGSDGDGSDGDSSDADAVDEDPDGRTADDDTGADGGAGDSDDEGYEEDRSGRSRAEADYDDDYDDNSEDDEVYAGAREGDADAGDDYAGDDYTRDEDGRHDDDNTVQGDTGDSAGNGRGHRSAPGGRVRAMASAAQARGRVD